MKYKTAIFGRYTALDGKQFRLMDGVAFFQGTRFNSKGNRMEILFILGSWSFVAWIAKNIAFRERLGTRWLPVNAWVEFPNL
jgi:hypothetical protein